MKVKSIHFTVIGRGAFPLDMLRYDACYPATGVDVERISLTRDNCEREEFEKPRKIRISKSGSIEPTSARWASFGWQVVDITKVR